MASFLIPFEPAGLTPPVQSAFEDLLAALQTYYDQGVIDQNSYFSAVQPRARYLLETAQTITTATVTALVWPGIGHHKVTNPNLAALAYDNGDSFSPRGMFLRKGNAAELTPPIGGQYLVIASASFEADATGRRLITIQQRNNVGTWTDVAGQIVPAVTGERTQIQASAVITIDDPVTEGYEQAVRVVVYQNSGGDLDATTGFDATWVQLIKLS